MTEFRRPVPADAIHKEKENLILTEEIHHISEQLDELICLLKNSTSHKNEILSEEPSSTDKEVMTVKEAAAMLRISLPKMYEFARSGKIHYLEVGRRILISRSSIIALLQEGDSNV
ncbi:MAG: helix-turn-helix domain-containing protein [Lachnospiraceae bacterium]|nr:helix-turn-helix domain-containing protein [Lachnospiraceae bacterium]